MGSNLDKDDNLRLILTELNSIYSLFNQILALDTSLNDKYYNLINTNLEDINVFNSAQPISIYVLFTFVAFLICSITFLILSEAKRKRDKFIA